MTKKLLFIIVALSFLVRFVNFNYPPLLWDEASLGYNAYSILKTGKDEYGTFLPFVFKSFGDYKPGLYVYLTVPFVAVLGLNSLAVRLPSIILGSLLPLILYLLIVRLSPKSAKLGLLSAALLALNPWNIHFSRGAWETNILLFELVMACYLFINKKIFLSAAIFGLTFYTYQGGKIMSPLLILILILVTRTKLFSKNFLIKFVFPLFIFSLPIIFGLLTQNDSNRLQVFGLWSYHRPTTEVDLIIRESNQLSFNVFHSEPLFFIRNFILRYFNHFSPRFLAFEGDWQIGRHSAPYIGVLLYPSLVFLIIGFFSALISPVSIVNKFFLLWLLIGPLPAALTLDIIQPVRTLPLSIPLLYFTAIGIISLSKIKLNYLRFSCYLFLVTSYILSFLYYSDLYYNHLVKVKPDHWLYGYEAAMKYTLLHQADKQITFTDFYGQPYIYYLFFSKYNPSQYQLQSNLVSDGLDTGRVLKIDNLKFETPNYQSLKAKPGQLFILSYDDALRQGIDLKLLTPLSPINGHSSFYAYETN